MVFKKSSFLFFPTQWKVLWDRVSVSVCHEDNSLETGQNDAKFDVAVGEKPSSKKSTGLIRLEFAKKTGGKNI